jgi:hypothetical protein
MKMKSVIKTKVLWILAAGLVIVFFSIVSNAEQAKASGQGEVKKFEGDFQVGIFFKYGNSFAMAPMFMDTKRPAVIKSADDKISENVLKDVCKNGNDLKIAPAVSRQMDKQQFNSYAEALHIAVFPNRSITVGEKLKATARFEPGPLTTIDSVIKKYGNPSEKEAWFAKDFKSWLGLNGIVYWWGAVGIAGSSDGTITHIFIREKEGVLNAKK